MSLAFKRFVTLHSADNSALPFVEISYPGDGYCSTTALALAILLQIKSGQISAAQFPLAAYQGLLAELRKLPAQDRDTGIPHPILEQLAEDKFNQPAQFDALVRDQLTAQETYAMFITVMGQALMHWVSPNTLTRNAAGLAVDATGQFTTDKPVVDAIAALGLTIGLTNTQDGVVQVYRNGAAVTNPVDAQGRDAADHVSPAAAELTCVLLNDANHWNLCLDRKALAANHAAAVLGPMEHFNIAASGTDLPQAPLSIEPVETLESHRHTGSDINTLDTLPVEVIDIDSQTAHAIQDLLASDAAGITYQQRFDEAFARALAPLADTRESQTKAFNHALSSLTPFAVLCKQLGLFETKTAERAARSAATHETAASQQVTPTR